MKSTYTIRRGDGHLPHVEVVDLKIHGGRRLRVAKAQDYLVDLTADQARHHEADGYLVAETSTKAAAPASALPPWPLQTPPADYIEQHQDDNPSPAVQERLALARRHVEAAGEE